MDIELKSKVDIFNETYKEVRKSFFLDGKKLNTIKALSSVFEGSYLDRDNIIEIRKYIYKAKLNLFAIKYSKFISQFLCEDKDYKKYFKTSKDIYEHLRMAGFGKNKITLAISMLLSKRYNEDKLNDFLEKIADLKKEIKLSRDDYYILLLLAKGDAKKIKCELNDTKKAIQAVDGYGDKVSTLLALSLLVGDEDINTKVENAFFLICNIKGEIGKVSENSFIFIGLASLIIEDSELFSKELKEVYSLLVKSNRSFNKDRLVLLSLSILIGRYIEEAEAGVTNSKVDNKCLKIIQDYIIFSLYFN